METTYCNIKIVYNEEAEQFEFNLRGRDRSASTLKKAKEAIDKPVADPKKAAFQPFEAYLSSYGSMPKKGRVTSIAETGSYRGTQVWFTKDGGERGKEYAKNLYAITPENDALLAEAKEAAAQMEAFAEKKSEALAKMAPATIPEVE